MKHTGFLVDDKKASGRHSLHPSLKLTKSKLAKNFVREMASEVEIQVVSKKVALEDLDELWRPFLVLTRASGVFPYLPAKRYHVVPWWRNAWNYYSVICLCSFIFILSIVIKHKVVSGLSISVVDVNDYSEGAFVLHMVISTSIFIYFLNSKTYLNDMFTVWSSLRFNEATAAKVNALIKRKIKYILTLCTISISIGATAYGLEFYLNIRGNFCILRFFHALFSLWCEIAGTFQVGLFCTLCYASSCLLKGISNDLQDELAKGSTNFNLKWFKDLYMTIIHFIDACNEFFGLYVGFLVVSFVLQACCNTYAFFSYEYNDYWFLPMLFWLLESYCIIVLVCLSAGEVSDQQMRPYRTLLTIELQNLSTRKQNQVLMLLDCFRNLNANIAMFRIIPITKQALPTVISAYLSYVFLLYQFPRGSTTGLNLLEPV